VPVEQADQTEIAEEAGPEGRRPLLFR
jgi:hypothetical protein